MSRPDFFTTLLILFVCVQPIFWMISLRRYKKYMNVRFRRIEEKLSLVCDCLGIEEEHEGALALIRELVRADLKPEAIEMFCEQTGAALAEAQKAIRAIEEGQL